MANPINLEGQRIARHMGGPVRPPAQLQGRLNSPDPLVREAAQHEYEQLQAQVNDPAGYALARQQQLPPPNAPIVAGSAEARALQARLEQEAQEELARQAQAQRQTE